MSKLGVSDQLKMTCRMVKARWAVWLMLLPEGWILGASAGLTASRRMVLGQLMEKTATVQWLAGSLSSGRTRSRGTRTYSKSLGCERIYIFPNSEKSSVLMVGAGDLSKPSRDFFKVLSLVPDADMPKVMAGTEPSRLSTLEIGGQVSYNVNQALDQVLEDIVPYFPGDGAYLTIRQGDVFLIEAVWNCEPDIKDFQISIKPNSILEQIAETRKAQIVHKVENLKNLVPPIQKRSQIKSWLGIPLGIGQRVIGLLGFVSYHPDAFNKSDLYRANELARYIAPSVENILAFAEAARYLKRLALLNEMASAASISLDVRSVARRVLRMLRRTFQTDRIGLMLIEENGETNQVFVENKPRSKNPQMPLDSSLTKHVLRKGMPVRIHRLGEQTDGTELVSARSALAVPLKYRGNIIGVLGLESTGSNLFSQQDERGNQSKSPQPKCNT
jgi:transcriptional regulator with GAF, ATPase, and Fis domain